MRDDASWLDPGAPTEGAGGPSNAGNGAGAVRFLLFFVFFLDLGARTSTLGATTGVRVVGVSAREKLTGTGVGGELTKIDAGGELTSVTAGGVVVGGVATGGVATRGVVVGARATTLDGGDAIVGDETGGVAIAALGDEAGGDEVGEATNTIDFGLEGKFSNPPSKHKEQHKDNLRRNNKEE
ncbi:hypothetical protein HKD37_02G003196 [Glycine soja]